MAGLTGLGGRVGSSRVAYAALWGAIALGIVPAIVAQTIIPLDGLMLNFGVEIAEMIYFHGGVCLWIFLGGAIVCILQKQYLVIVLLLPWLALYVYDADRLTSKLPTYSEVQQQRSLNLESAKEKSDPPSTKAMRDKLKGFEDRDTRLTSFTYTDLDSAIIEFETNPLKTNSSYDSQIAKDIGEITRLSLQIAQAASQIRKINKAKRQTRFISRFSLGLTDKHLKDRLDQGLKKVTRHKKKLESRRNALRAKLGRLADARAASDDRLDALLELDAKVATYPWAAQAWRDWQKSVAYSAICLLVLLVLICRFSLGSWHYLFTLSAAFTVSLLYVEAPLAFRLWNIAQFVFISMFIRLFYLVFTQNYPLIRGQPGSFLRRVCASTVYYYALFIVLILAGFALSAQIDGLVDDNLRNAGVLPEPDKVKHDRRYYIDRHVNDYYVTQEENTREELKRWAGEGRKSLAQIEEKMLGLYDDSLPQNPSWVTGEDPCKSPDKWVLKTAYCIEIAANNAIHATYGRFRLATREALQESAGDYADKVGNRTDQAVEIAIEDLSAMFLAARLTTLKQLGYLYSLIDFYAWMSLLVLSALILKSLGYVFARIFFGTPGGNDSSRVIQFEAAAQPEQRGSIEGFSERIDLSAAMGECFYVNKRFDFANAPPDEVTPQAHKAFFSRLRNGAWHMNRIATDPSDDSRDRPYRRIPDDERILAWTLKPGDAVIFRWQSFVGMSDAIRIRTQFSWQLSSLLFGRMFFVVASVDPDAATDGTLLLAARGADGVDPDDNPSNSPDQLLAWQTTTRFELHAQLSYRNIYRSGIQIRAQQSDLAIMHLNPEKRKSGAAAFLKYFLVPV